VARPRRIPTGFLVRVADGADQHRTATLGSSPLAVNPILVSEPTREGHRPSCRWPRPSLLPAVLLFHRAALAEIGGAWLVCQSAREHRDLVFVGAGILPLTATGS
jgi:hypothetical protein